MTKKQGDYKMDADGQGALYVCMCKHGALGAGMKAHRSLIKTLEEGMHNTMGAPAGPPLCMLWQRSGQWCKQERRSRREVWKGGKKG